MKEYAAEEDNPVFHWCFIGTGKLAGIVAEQICATGRHEIVSVYTRNIEKGRAFAEKFGGRAYESAEEAITAEGVDGVYIVTPHNAHYDYAYQALQHGIPVLCEKAMTSRAEETEALFALAKEKNVYLAEAMWTWFSPIANQVKAWLDEGRFGTIKSVHGDMCVPGAGYAPRVTDPNTAGGALLDIGVYPITYIYRLFGVPKRIVCNGTVKNGIDTDDHIEMIYPNGQTFTVALDLYGDRNGGWFEIKGTDASLRISHFHYAKEAVLQLRDGTELRVEGDGGYVNEFDIVAKEIRSGKKESDYVKAAYTIDVMHLLDSCRAQIGLVYPYEDPDIWK